jgi:hypothetical protein
LSNAITTALAATTVNSPASGLHRLVAGRDSVPGAVAATRGAASLSFAPLASAWANAPQLLNRSAGAFSRHRDRGLDGRYSRRVARIGRGVSVIKRAMIACRRPVCGGSPRNSYAMAPSAY